MSDDFIAMVMKPNFHAVNFEFNKKHYTISGWWQLEIIPDLSDFSKSTIVRYPDRRSILADPIFDGFCLPQITNRLEDVVFDFEPE